MTKNERFQRIRTAAQEISRYIERRPNAAETAEGITNWWIRRQRLEESVDIVQSALEYLVDKNLLKKRETGNQIIYMRVA